MEKMATVFGYIFLSFIGIFFFVIFSALIGGLAGWVVGLFFGDTILNIAGQLGIKNVTMFELGTFLGFVGGFMKTKVTTSTPPDFLKK